MSNEEERNMQKKKKKKKVDVVKCRSRPYYFRRCKQKKQSLSSISRTTSIDSLPDELVFQILVHLEAEEIYKSAMLVCRRWCKITRTQHFVQEHLNRSAPSLLITDYHHWIQDGPFRILSGRGRTSIHKFQDHPIFEPKLIFWSTCNGLTLEQYLPRLSGGFDKFSVANYTINKRFELPPFPLLRNRMHYSSCIGYAPASNVHKVLHIFDTATGNPNLDKCAVLTLGVDKSWRYIHTQHISVARARLFVASPFIAQGFVHWAKWSSTSLLSLNLETEIITESLIPEEARVHLEYNCYLSNWRSLTLLIASPRGSLSWDVWELMTESGEWKKVVKIDLEAQKCRLEQHLACTLPEIGLKPVGWLNCMEVLVLRVGFATDMACVLYNIGTQETQFLDLGRVGGAYIHKNSLVWFDPPPT